MRFESVIVGAAVLLSSLTSRAESQEMPARADAQPTPPNSELVAPSSPSPTTTEAAQANAGSAVGVQSSGSQSPVAAVGATAVQNSVAVARPVFVPQPNAPAAARVNPEAPLETGPVPAKGKWNPVIYGFVEFDALHDSTQSFSELEGNGAIASPATYGGKHGRTMFSVRNSRLGLKLSAPETEGVKTSGIIEMDFLGNQPGTPPAISEGSYFVSPTFRVRHFAVKLESEYVDVLLGQYWQLFGWQSYFHPNTVQLQGVPGQLYSRSPQVRVSHTFRSSPVNLELAIAAARPPQRDSEVPDGQAGVRVLFNQWKGVHTMGGAGTAADAAAIGVSGVARRFVVPAYEAHPTSSRSTSGWGVSMDALVPVIPASMQDRANALTLTGSWVVGRGISDLFTGLSDGNTASWPLPNPSGATPAPTFAPNVNIDSGLIEYGASGAPHSLRWQVLMGGIQYYLPPSGRVWVSVNYSHMKSSNILRYVGPAAGAALFDQSDWYDANLFWDFNLATRFGLEYARTKQTFGDDSTRTNHRVQFSGWLIF